MVLAPSLESCLCLQQVQQIVGPSLPFPSIPRVVFFGGEGCAMATGPHLPSNPPYICVSIVKLTPCPPQETTPLRFAVRTAAKTQADATLPCIGVRGGTNRQITPGPHRGPFGGARQRWCISVHQRGGHTSPLFHIPHTTRHGDKHISLSLGSPQSNSHMRLGASKHVTIPFWPLPRPNASGVTRL